MRGDQSQPAKEIAVEQAKKYPPPCGSGFNLPDSAKVAAQLGLTTAAVHGLRTRNCRHLEDFVMAKSRPSDLLAIAADESPGIPLFRTSTRASNDVRFEWAGESLQDFLHLAVKAGARILYLRTSEEDPAHKNEPALAELAFHCDGLFHCFRAVAPWADAQSVLAEDDGAGPADDHFYDDEQDDVDDDEPNDGELAAKLSAEEDDVAAAFSEYVLKSDEPISTQTYHVKTALDEYLAEHRGGPAESWSLPKYAKVVERIAKRVAKDIGDREKSMIDGLVTECIAWARASGLKTLNQSDAEVFLREANHRVSHEGLRLVWQKVKLELKTRR